MATCALDRVAINGGMFLVEISAGAAAGAAPLPGDALDFLGDAANCGISLTVAGMRSPDGRACPRLGWGDRDDVVAALAGKPPEAAAMGAAGVLALLANAGVALMLFRFRGGGRVRHRQRMARSDGRTVMAWARPRWRLADHVPGERRIAVGADGSSSPWRKASAVAWRACDAPEPAPPAPS